jgi:hypothetical protein
MPAMKSAMSSSKRASAKPLKPIAKPVFARPNIVAKSVQPQYRYNPWSPSEPKIASLYEPPVAPQLPPPIATPTRTPIGLGGVDPKVAELQRNFEQGVYSWPVYQKLLAWAKGLPAAGNAWLKHAQEGTLGEW